MITLVDSPCPDARADRAHGPHPWGGLQKGGPFRCKGIVATEEPVWGECPLSADRADHLEHRWYESDPTRPSGERPFTCLGWPLPAWAHENETEGHPSSANSPTATLGVPDGPTNEGATALQRADSSERAQGSAIVRPDPKEDTMATHAPMGYQQALGLILAEQPPLQTEEGQTRWKEAYRTLHDMAVSLEGERAHSIKLATDLDQEKRGRATEAAAHRAQMERAGAEITKLREQVQANARRAQEQVARDIEIDQALQEMGDVGSLLLDAREAIDWLRSLQNGGVPQVLRPADVERVVSVFARLEAYARKQAHVEKAPLTQTISEGLLEIRDNTPGNAETVDALCSALGLALKVIEREQRARLRKEVGR